MSGQGSAGRRGEDVRSDLHVLFEPRDSGGTTVAVESKVAAYYGQAIETQAREVLAAVGIEHGALTITDRGALPFVITARIATAVRRSGIEALSPPPGLRAAPVPTDRERLRRSRLYLPGNEPKYMVNAGLHGADAVILDLEDSVHPTEKDAARDLVRSALASLELGCAERMVRINQLPLGLDDLQAVLPAAPDLILIPKVESAGQVREVSAEIDRIASTLRFDWPVWLMPILESARGVESAYEIATASERVVALTIGLEDYTADLGVVKTPSGDESLYARQRLVNAARAAGVQAIDSVWGDVGDLEGLERWAARSRGLGFEGMGCVHPRQIPVIHRAFAPSAAEIAKAKRIVAAFEEAERTGQGVVSLGSKMIDLPVVAQAVQLVQRARAMGLDDERRPQGGA